MAEQDTLPGQVKKYLFDLHNFDDSIETLAEEAPPPVFSEAELEAARKSSFEQGRTKGLADSAASRDQAVAALLDKMAKELSSLFLTEGARASLYESESVFLARAIFNKLFPALNEKHGLAELEHAIIKVLEAHRDQPTIKIEVHPDYVDTIRDHVTKTQAKLNGAGQCLVTGNDSLGHGDCRLNWHNGGATRSAEALSEEISKLLAQTLADRPPLRDNGTEAADQTQNGE